MNTFGKTVSTIVNKNSEPPLNYRIYPLRPHAWPPSWRAISIHNAIYVFERFYRYTQMSILTSQLGMLWTKAKSRHCSRYWKRYTTSYTLALHHSNIHGTFAEGLRHHIVRRHCVPSILRSAKSNLADCSLIVQDAKLNSSSLFPATYAVPA